MSAQEGGAAAASSSAHRTSNVTANAKMEALLEQLRAKHNVPKSLPSDTWNEFAKQIRMASLVSFICI